MNILPEILREPITQTVYRRQGPQYLLKLGGHSSRVPAISSERNSAHASTRLKVNRYSIDKGDFESRRSINYSTISYDFRNDPEFYGSKGKKDQIQSYQNLIAERQKEAAIVQAKTVGFRGTKQQYISELKVIQKTISTDIAVFQQSFIDSIITLKQTLSELRRYTHAQIKSFKQDLKQENEELIIYCEELKRIDGHFKRVKESLQPTQ